MASEIRVNQIQSRTGVSTISFTETGPIISGVTTITGDLDVTGLVSYDDVTNIDSVGVVTARDGIDVTGGTVTITTGANSASPAASGNNLVIKDSDGCGLSILSGNGNSQNIYLGSVSDNDAVRLEGFYNSGSPYFNIYTAGSERLRITSAGRIGINQTSPDAMLQVDYDEGSSEVGLRLRAYNASGSKTWQLSEINGNAGVFTIRNATNFQNILNIDGVNQRVGVNDSTPDATLSVGGSTAFIDIGEAGGNRGKIGYSSNDLYFGTSSSSGAFIFKTNVTSTDNPASSGSEKVRISSGGLAINKNAAADTDIEIVQSADPTLRLYDTRNAAYKADFLMAGSAPLIRNNNTTASDRTLTVQKGTTDHLVIEGSGSVRKPLQPLAIIGTTQNNYTPTTGDTLPFDYSNTNRGNHYNTSNYTFTCPVAGDYMVILRFSRKGWVGDLELAKNNSQYARLELRETGRNNSNNADWQALCYDFIVPCSANDTLKWKVPSQYTGTGGGNYLLDGYNHIYYDSVTYYLMG